MANHVSAKKRVRQNAKRAKINSANRSRIRTFVKKVEMALVVGDVAGAETALLACQPELQKSVTKGILPKRTASRKMSRLSARIKAAKSK
ncbi:MAG: 30S ribosomal protein S20 [Alphaproteobacteria bacterium]|jgi:small subunit ribosomal protein S20|nr:30S ribosomal protein S20 [Alphaproteobacteria bacterium]MCB1551828.1 30S ribosomal protein S20 [Alphaproteobacteria bacterium]MCB9984163.1 30S ribosomal protein S20 [Micavibrio sp.]HPQ50522.1 30S ribosomal protein S20 [Alphaproteobacteria bacterium]HRK97010.1 30S ribosomal protein S20 [Alphaproteobacteria bacterium]